MYVEIDFPSQDIAQSQDNLTVSLRRTLSTVEILAKRYIKVMIKIRTSFSTGFKLESRETVAIFCTFGIFCPILNNRARNEIQGNIMLSKSQITKKIAMNGTTASSLQGTPAKFRCIGPNLGDINLRFWSKNSNAFRAAPSFFRLVGFYLKVYTSRLKSE